MIKVETKLFNLQSNLSGLETDKAALENDITKYISFFANKLKDYSVSITSTSNKDDVLFTALVTIVYLEK